MRAAIFKQYGSPDVVQIAEVAKPTPKDNEILIKVQEAIVTPTDIANRTGNPFIIRFFTGLRQPKKPILGTDLAGEVAAVGKNVTRFKKGDLVVGASNMDFGAHAEYICLPEDGVLAIIPANKTYEEVAGVCDGAMTAWIFLTEKARIQPGQKILINGASGSIGTFAIQIAKYYGAEVTGVCSGKNVNLVKSLGADHVIDYTQEDFTQNKDSYDIIFDAVGKSSFGQCKRALKKGGVYLTTVPSLGIVLQMLRTSLFGGKKAIFAATGLMYTKETLSILTDLMKADKLKAITDRHYPLEQIADAHRYVETGRKTGNVIIQVAA